MNPISLILLYSLYSHASSLASHWRMIRPTLTKFARFFSAEPNIKLNSIKWIELFVSHHLAICWISNVQCVFYYLINDEHFACARLFELWDRCSFSAGFFVSAFCFLFSFPLISRSVDVPVAIAHYGNTICTLHCVWIKYLRTHEYWTN